MSTALNDFADLVEAIANGKNPKALIFFFVKKLFDIYLTQIHTMTMQIKLQITAPPWTNTQNL
jgi:hypothetical protein